jgi:hypothetical protein
MDRSGRRLRRLMLAAVPLSLCFAAAQASAQQEQLFQNSWFWGVHGGATSVGTPGNSMKQAGTFGADWMITRTNGGLYVAYDQASFNHTTGIADGTAAGGVRPVSVHDLRTISIGGLAFPWHSGHFRPYAGLGYALSIIGDASAQPDSLGTPVPAGMAESIDNARSRSSIFVMLGAQWQVRRTALYAQASVIPSSDQFLVTRPITNISAGIRYNFGSSIDRQ